MAKKEKIGDKEVTVYESVNLFEESSADEVREKISKESEFEEKLSKAAEMIKSIYDPKKDKGRVSGKDNGQKLDMYWKIGDVILTFQEEQGFGRKECSKCGYKNLESKKNCKICGKSLNPSKESSESYKTARKLIKRISNREDIKPKTSSLENMRNFRLLFPEQNYDKSLSFSKYRELGYLARYPQSIWKELYEKMQSGELTNHKKDIRPKRNELMEEFKQKQ